MPVDFKDDCPNCKAQRGRKVRLEIDTSKGPVPHIVCRVCGFDMTDPDYAHAKMTGRL